MIFEEIAELVRMTIDSVDGRVTGDLLAAPQQFRVVRNFDVAMIAQACSLDPSDIEVRRHPPCLASCGAPFVIAEVRDRAALRRAQQRMDVFLSHLPRDEVTGIHLYVEDAARGRRLSIADVCAAAWRLSKTPRPAARTSRLSGLLAHLQARTVVATGGCDRTRRSISDEPSLLRAVAEKVDGAVTGTFIGGGCKPVMSGWIDLRMRAF